MMILVILQAPAKGSEVAPDISWRCMGELYATLVDCQVSDYSMMPGTGQSPRQVGSMWLLLERGGPKMDTSIL